MSSVAEAFEESPLRNLPVHLALFEGPLDLLLHLCRENKVDLKDQVQVTEDDMVQAVKAYDSPFRFTSAKTGGNVELAFQSLAERIAKERFARKLISEE